MPWFPGHISPMGELQNKKTKLSKTRPLWVYPSSLFLFLLCANDPPCPHGSTLPKPRSPERAACPSSTRCQCVSPTRHVVPHLRIPLWSSPLLGSSPWPWQSLCWGGLGGGNAGNLRKNPRSKTVAGSNGTIEATERTMGVEVSIRKGVGRAGALAVSSKSSKS